MPLLAFLLAMLLAVTPISCVLAEQGASPPAQSLDINAASVQQLAEHLPGIGPAKAARIIQWRADNGAFKSIEQLQDVKGIGPKTLDKLRPLIRVGSPAASAARRAVSDGKEQQVRADIRQIVSSVRLAASPDAIARMPKSPWYKRSALEIFRTH